MMTIGSGAVQFQADAYFMATTNIYATTNFQAGSTTFFDGELRLSSQTPFDLDGTSWVNGNLIMQGNTNLVTSAEAHYPTIDTVVYLGIASTTGARNYNLRLQRTGNRVDMHLCAPSTSTLTPAALAVNLFIYTTAGATTQYSIPVGYRSVCTATYDSHVMFGTSNGVREAFMLDILCAGYSVAIGRSLEPTSNTFGAAVPVHLGCHTFSWLTNLA
jgi:hypothetical protein